MGVLVPNQAAKYATGRGRAFCWRSGRALGGVGGRRLLGTGWDS
jgi:hypothetical protein